MTGTLQEMPRVVHVIAGLGQGGAETVLYRLLRATQPPRGHVVISLGDEGVFGARLRAIGIDVYALGMNRAAGRLAGPWRLYRLLRRLRPDVVQTWMYHADVLGGVVARLAGVRAVAWGIRNSGVDLAASSRTARALAAVAAPLSRCVPGAIVACAEAARRQHVRWGYDARRMVVIPNGYDFERWAPDPARRAVVRQEWALTPEAPVVGCVARWDPLKDHDNLCAAIALVRRTRPEVRLVLMGEGMTADNAALLRLLAQHGLDDGVLLLGRRSDVPRLMQGLDVHVLASRAEGFPNVLAEAMAAGVACVTTDVGDAALIAGTAARVVPPRDAPALAAALDAALAARGSSAEQERIDQGRARVQARFGLPTVVARWEAVWTALAAGRRPGAPRLLMVVNEAAFFLSHRLPVAQAARAAGYEVHLATRAGAAVRDIQALGFAHHVLPLSRSGRNPLAELRLLWALWRLMRRLRPDIVHAVTIKPVLYGGLAARLGGAPAFVAAVSGLGHVFVEDGRRTFLRRAVTALYRRALGHRHSRVIFQNPVDQATLTTVGALRPDQAVLIPGSGVDLAQFHEAPELPGPVIIVCVSRMLAEKGIAEFVAAARQLRAQRPQVHCWLAGAPDPGNPSAIREAQLRDWDRAGWVRWLGQCDDVAALYHQAHIAVLASYREGLPRSLVEAAACGRAIVTTDVPGCRDAVQAGVTGVLVPARDSDALARALLALVDDPARRQAMGRAGRRLAEQRFGIDGVVARHLALYDSLLPPAARPSFPPNLGADD